MLVLWGCEEYLFLFLTNSVAYWIRLSSSCLQSPKDYICHHLECPSPEYKLQTLVSRDLNTGLLQEQWVPLITKLISLACRFYFLGFCLFLFLLLFKDMKVREEDQVDWEGRIREGSVCVFGDEGCKHHQKYMIHVCGTLPCGSQRSVLCSQYYASAFPWVLGLKANRSPAKSGHLLSPVLLCSVSQTGFML